MQYALQFSRYNRQRAERRDSNIMFTEATDFDQGVRIANAMLKGMREADPDSDYAIVKVDASHNYHGIDCSGGGFLFETGEEFSARVAARQESAS